MKLKKQLTKEQHDAIGKDIRDLSIRFSEHYKAINRIYGRDSKESKLMHKFLNIVTSKLCNELDKRWYNEDISDSHMDNPYYGKNKICF